MLEPRGWYEKRDSRDFVLKTFWLREKKRDRVDENRPAEGDVRGDQRVGVSGSSGEKQERGNAVFNAVKGSFYG